MIRYRATIVLEVEAPDTLRAARQVESLSERMLRDDLDLGVCDTWVGDVPEEIPTPAELRG